MAAKPAEDPGGVRGQIEMLRDNALGNFQTLLVEIAKDTAMLIWLDGRTNVRARPQENFGREIMELFTMGVGHYTEADVYAAARVFTGWNLTRVGGVAPYLTFFYNAAQHDTAAKTFTFPIYPDGRKTIPARGAGNGMQDGLDFIAALARSPHTAAYLAPQAVSLLRVGVRRRRPGVRRPRVGDLLPERLQHERGDARGADVAAVLGRAQPVHALRLAGRVHDPR